MYSQNLVVFKKNTTSRFQKGRKYGIKFLIHKHLLSVKVHNIMIGQYKPKEIGSPPNQKWQPPDVVSILLIQLAQNSSDQAESSDDSISEGSAQSSSNELFYEGESSQQQITFLGGQILTISSNGKEHLLRCEYIQVSSKVKDVREQSLKQTIPVQTCDIKVYAKFGNQDPHYFCSMATEDRQELTIRCEFDEPKSCFKIEDEKQAKQFKVQIDEIPISECSLNHSNKYHLVSFLQRIATEMTALLYKIGEGQFYLDVVVKKQKSLLCSEILSKLFYQLKKKFEVMAMGKTDAKIQKEQDQACNKYRLSWGLKSSEKMV